MARDLYRENLRKRFFRRIAWLGEVAQTKQVRVVKHQERKEKKWKRKAFDWLVDYALGK